MSDNLLIIMLNTDYSNPVGLVSPFFQATVAAAMEYDVEIVLDGCAARLAIKGEAEKLLVRETGDKTVYDVIKDAYEVGVKFKLGASVSVSEDEELIPEIEDTVGDAYIIGEVMDNNTVTLTY